MAGVHIGSFTPFTAREGEGPRAVLQGPDISVPALAAQPLGMAVHELATNAVKYGALSSSAGLVAVDWRVEEQGPRRMLLIRWAESGGPPVEGPPARRGFGTRVLDGTLRRQLEGEVRVDWERGGIAVEIRVPIGAAAGTPSAAA